jgi:hypothetical protein
VCVCVCVCGARVSRGISVYEYAFVCVCMHACVRESELRLQTFRARDVTSAYARVTSAEKRIRAHVHHTRVCMCARVCVCVYV